MLRKPLSQITIKPTATPAHLFNDKKSYRIRETKLTPKIELQNWIRALEKAKMKPEDVPSVAVVEGMSENDVEELWLRVGMIIDGAKLNNCKRDFDTANREILERDEEDDEAPGAVGPSTAESNSE